MGATYAGISLPTNPGMTWGHTWGESPFETTVDAPAALAKRLYDAGSGPDGAELVLSAYGFSVPIKRVRAIEVRAGPRPDVHAVHLVDVRWSWQFQRYRRVANVRVTTNARRRIVPGAPLAVKQLLPAEAFRGYSLKDNGTAWTALELIEDVAKAVGGRLEFNGSLDPATRTALTQRPENVWINDRLDVAVSRVLAYAGGGVSVFVDANGQPVFAPTRDQSERVLFGVGGGVGGTRVRGAAKGIGPQVVGTPCFLLLDRRVSRPSGYRILFDRRQETRLDYGGDESEGDWAENGTRRRKGASPRLDLINVMTVPDEKLTIKGREVLQGVWVPIYSYLVAKAGTWAPPDRSAGPTLALLRASWVAGGLQEFAQPLYDDAGTQQRAIGRIRSSYRAGGGTFQIRRELRERVARWDASIGSIVDPQTGSRPSAPVYADHSSWLGWRSPAQEKASDPLGTALVRNYFADGSKTGGPISGVAITSLKRAPANVSVRDQDLGILRVDFRVDETGEVIKTIGSACDATNLPSVDPTQRDMLLQWGVIAKEHRLAVVLTAELAAPSGEEGLYAVEIDTADALKRAGGTGQAATGPVCTLYIPASSMTADFGWDDGRAEQIRGVLGGSLEATVLDDLCLNREIVHEIALAAAAAHVGERVDRVDGGLTTSLRPVRPLGGAGVQHHVSASGATTTAASAPSLTAAPLEALLPEGLRRMVLRRLP